MKNNKVYSPVLFILLLGLFVNSASAQVGFNNPNPHPSSLLDLTAKDKGLLIPRMTSTQRLAIANPANGLIVFDITLKSFCYYDTVANPDKWMLLSALKADANPNGHAILNTTGNVGIGVTTPVHKLEVAGNIKASDTLIATVGRFTGTVIANSFSGNGSVPSGAIILWYGSTPPAGWVICDGNNGTPDLRGRFVLGAGQNQTPASGDINPTYTVGATGGENVHTLTKSELPKHKHTVSSTLTDNGQVTNASTSTNDSYAVVNAGGTPLFFAPAVGAEIRNNVTATSHTHTISGNTGDGTTDGITAQSHENRPPYYVLTYIMKQ
jgi:microcystin-dependent protein